MQREKARRIGLFLAMFMRIGLLMVLSWIVGLTAPLFTVTGTEISGRDLILIAGGLFLVWKSTMEIHQLTEGEEGHASKGVKASFAAIIVQIIIIDMVFSLDSIITAVGLVDELAVMIAAVIASVGLMMLFARAIGDFVSAHPSIKMLALSFLLLVGVMLIAEGFDHKVPKGYIYFAMAFSVAVEMLNIRMRKKKERSRQASRTVREGLSHGFCTAASRGLHLDLRLHRARARRSLELSVLDRSRARAHAAHANARPHGADVADRTHVIGRARAPAPRLIQVQGESIMAFTNNVFRGPGNAGSGGVDLPIRKILRWAVVIAIAIIVVSVAGCGIKVVDTGQRGVKTRFGEITSTSLPEGLYFFNPITTKIIEIDTRVKRLDGETESYTRDVQQANIKYTLNYRLQQNQAHTMYRDVGTDWETAADSAGRPRHVERSRRQVGRGGPDLQPRQGDEHRFRADPQESRRALRRNIALRDHRYLVHHRIRELRWSRR